MNKKEVMIGTGSFLIGTIISAGAAALFWNKKEAQRTAKELERLTCLKAEIAAFTEPTIEKVRSFNQKSLNGIAYKLEQTDFFNDIDGFSCLAIKSAILILKEIAETMQANETLSDFESRIKK